MNPCVSPLIEAINHSTEKRLWIVDENITPAVIAGINSRGNLSAITNRCDIGRALQQRGINAIVNDFDFSSLTDVTGIVYRISKERLLAQHCIAEAHRILTLNGTLSLFGEKNDGIKTLGKFASTLFANDMHYEKLGQCYCVQLTRSTSATTTTFEDSYNTLQLIQQNDVEFYSKPGIYGWKKVDIGSRLLIETIKPLLTGMATKSLSLLDLGCGYGYLLMQLAQLPFRQMIATDNSATAMVAVTKNVSWQQLSATLLLGDCAEGLAQPIDIIVCNPPFHQGFGHDKHLITRFINRSLELLSANGQAFFVVNEFIGLEKTVSQLNGSSTSLAHQNGFKVYRITR